MANKLDSPRFAKQALVNCFSWCSCNDPEYGFQHVQLQSRSVSIESGEAIAISYAIGDFGRTAQVLGHQHDDTNKVVRLTFGDEWVIPDLIVSLVKLSQQHGWIWFDQLSIPQDPTLIPLHLQRVPEIYRTFDVIILWPIAPCHCLTDAINGYAAKDQALIGDDGDLNHLPILHGCPNAQPISSYHFRLWTRQEFEYAKRISLHYCSQPTTGCSRGSVDWSARILRLSSAHLNFLGPWAKWKYHQCLEEVSDQTQGVEEAAWSLYSNAIRDGLRNFLFAVRHFKGKASINYLISNDNHDQLDVAMFLQGSKLERSDSPVDDFLGMELLHGSHLASVKEDFVFAVMLQLKSYRIPEEQQSMTLDELVDDALEQYEDAKDMRVQSTLPQGLFEYSYESMRCKPSLYLDPGRVHDLGDVYAALESSGYKSITDHGHVMLRRRTGIGTPKSRMTQATTYAAAFRNKTSSDAQSFMRRVGACKAYKFGRGESPALSPWARSVIFGDIAVTQSSWPSPAHQKALFEGMFYHLYRDWEDLPEMDHETVCFELMCQFAGIHPNIAREKDLGLMVKLDDPPCIGLVNGAVYREMEEAETAFRLEHPGSEVDMLGGSLPLVPGDTLSVAVTDCSLEANKTILVLETANVHQDFDPAVVEEAARQVPIPTYMVVGVWFWSRKDDPFIGAELAGSWEECDAVLL